jgi:hypothetical protein
MQTFILSRSDLIKFQQFLILNKFPRDKLFILKEKNIRVMVLKGKYFNLRY